MMNSHNKTSKKHKIELFDYFEDFYDATLCADIANARHRAGLTQKQLAELIGTSQPVIARAETGLVPPSHNRLKQIARALRVRIMPPSFVSGEKTDLGDVSFAESGVLIRVGSSTKEHDAQIHREPVFVPVLKTSVRASK